MKRKRSTSDARLSKRPVQFRRLTPSLGPPPRVRGRYGTRKTPMTAVGWLGDKKYIDTAEANYVLNTTGSITHISIVPTGTNVNSREGKAFQVTSASIRGFATSDTTTTTTLGWIALVWDYQPNKALPVLTDIWDAISGSAMIKRENNARFKIILYRRYLFVGNSTTPTADKAAYDVDEFGKLPKDAVALCTSADTTGVIGNRLNGALYLCTGGSTAAGTADANTSLYCRVNFSEI